MHHLRKLNRRLFLILPLMALLLSACVAKLNPEFSHQGRLLDETGVPVPDGDYEVVYSLYQAATGGTAVYSETQTVPVSDGLFTTSIGLSSTITPTLFAQPTWLEVSVDGETLTPRQRMQGAPYAFSLSSGSVVQGIETLDRSYLSFDDTGASLTALNIDSSATGGHGLVTINLAAAEGNEREKTGALYAYGAGGVFDTSDGNPDSGAVGAVIRSKSYRGMYVQGGIDISNAGNGYYAAVFESPSGILVTGGGSCTGCTVAYVAQNTGAETIEAGDFVAVSGVTVDADLNIPVMQVYKATRPDDAVIGVATGALARTDVTIQLDMPLGGYDAQAGPAESGMFVNIAVQGLVQARAATGAALQPGSGVSLNTTGAIAATDAGIARAMSTVDADGLVWVLLGGARSANGQ